MESPNSERPVKKEGEESGEIWKPDVLVLGPGAIKGFYMLGGLSKLEHNGYLSNVKVWVGVSIGSVISLLLICGYSIKEIIEIAINTDILSEMNDVYDRNDSRGGDSRDSRGSESRDRDRDRGDRDRGGDRDRDSRDSRDRDRDRGDRNDDNRNVGDILSMAKTMSRAMIEGMGMMSIQVMKKSLDDLMIAKFGSSLTLKELYTRTGQTLETVVRDITKQTTLYFNHKTFPDELCTDAVLRSCNMPFVFTKVIFKGSLCTDGALGDPYPILRYDNGKNKILGMYIYQESKPEQNNDPLSYIRAIVDSAMYSLRDMSIRYCSKNCKHIRLYISRNDVVGPLSCSLDSKAKMIGDGFSITQRFTNTLEGIPNVDSDIIPASSSPDGVLISTQSLADQMDDVIDRMGTTILSMMDV